MKLFDFDVDRKWDYENGFYLTSHFTRIPKMIAQYELYKSIVNLPGHVIEFGVFKGASLIRFLTFRSMLESPYSRKIIGFDAFGKFPARINPDDKKFIESFEKEAGDGIPIEELERVLSYKKFENYELIKGDILDTIPNYVANHPELKIAFLHIDVDVYEPTLEILNFMYERVVRGGVILFDDFGTVAGETRAIDEFFKDKNEVIEKLPVSHIPSFIRKL
jgi:hypothetical protein